MSVHTLLVSRTSGIAHRYPFGESFEVSLQDQRLPLESGATGSMASGTDVLRGLPPGLCDLALGVDRHLYVINRLIAHRLARTPRTSVSPEPHSQPFGGKLPTAQEAREWTADGGLHGIGNSLYTPFSGVDGDDIDYEAYRELVRYCVGDLGHPMLWLTSGIAEWWSLTIDERKKLTEIAIDEARAVAPDTVIQACTSASAAKDCLELTLHAQEYGADICYLQTPPMEVHAGEGVQRFFQYIADRSDIALGMFNSGSSGYALSPPEVAQIYTDIPAVCAIKEGMMEPHRSAAIHRLAPGLVVWECNTLVYRAGWLQDGIVCPAQLGTAGYLHETPDNKRFTAYWTLIWDGRIADAIEYARTEQLDQLFADIGGWYTQYPGRPDYFTHWGEAFRYAASVIGLPVGDYPHSRPPQGILPDVAKEQIRTAYERAGLAKVLVTS